MFWMLYIHLNTLSATRLVSIKKDVELARDGLF